MGKARGGGGGLRGMAGVSILAAGLLSQGCGGDGLGREVAAETDLVLPGISPATSVNAMMVGVVDHAAHHIWDLGRDGMAPVTDEDWDEVWHASVQLISAAAAITTGGTTGSMDDVWVRDPRWRNWAQALMNAAVMAYDAARKRDLEGVLWAGDPLVVACEGCHSQFKPASPTEGIVHPHYDQ
jgi:hypothetical protein